MTIIGTVWTNDKGYTGIIESLTLKADIIFEPISRKSSDKSPDFRIVTSPSGYEIGAAWLSHTPDTGAQILSAKLDDPSFAEPIHCRLIKTGAEQTYSLIWERNRKRA